MAQTSAGMGEPELPQKQIEHPEEMQEAAHPSLWAYRSTPGFLGQDQPRALEFKDCPRQSAISAIFYCIFIFLFQQAFWPGALE